VSSEYTPLSFPTPLAERKRIQNSLGAGKGQVVFSPSNRLDENKLLWHRKFSHAKTLNMMDVVLGVTLHKFNQIFTWQTVGNHQTSTLTWLLGVAGSKLLMAIKYIRYMPVLESPRFKEIIDGEFLKKLDAQTSPSSCLEHSPTWIS